MSRGRDIEMLQAFCLATVEILRETTGVAARFELDPSADAAIDDPIIVLLHARGDVLSGLTWTFPASIARAVAMRMIDDPDPGREICRAAASELANILTGRGSRAFELRGYRFEIDPPEIAVAGPPGLTRRFMTACGPVEVVFHLTSARAA